MAVWRMGGGNRARHSGLEGELWQSRERTRRQEQSRDKGARTHGPPDVTGEAGQHRMNPGVPTTMTTRQPFVTPDRGQGWVQK